MAYLARVRDGSSGAIADGYWLCQVVAVENEDTAIVPLVSALYAQAAPDFVSENAELKAALAAVSEACAGRGVWVIDRAGDRGELDADLLAAGRAFVVRQKGDRLLLWGWRTIATARLATDCPLSHAPRIVRQENGQEVSCRLDYGCRPVRLPERHPDQAGDPRHPPRHRRQTRVRHPELPPLCPRRRQPRDLRQLAPAPATRRQRPAPAHSRLPLRFLGKVLSDTACPAGTIVGIVSEHRNSDQRIFCRRAVGRHLCSRNETTPRLMNDAAGRRTYGEANKRGAGSHFTPALFSEHTPHARALLQRLG